MDDTVKPCVSYILGGMCSRPDMFRCLEFIKMHEPSLSYSALKDYSQCHRKFWHGWIEGRELIEKKRPLRLGSLADDILQILHSNKKSETAVSEYRGIIETKISESIDEEDPEKQYGDLDFWRMRALFDAYIEKDVHTMKGDTQYEFRWKVPGYPKIHGFIDLKENRIGHEYKYTTNADYYSHMFNVREQLMSYFIGAPEIEGFRLHAIVNPVNFKLHKDESIQAFYDRVKVDIKRRLGTVYHLTYNFWRTEFNLQEYMDKAKMISEEIMRYIVADYPDPKYPFYQNTQACHQPFECDFFPICNSGVMPENLYKKREKRG